MHSHTMGLHRCISPRRLVGAFLLLHISFTAAATCPSVTLDTVLARGSRGTTNKPLIAGRSRAKIILTVGAPSNGPAVQDLNVLLALPEGMTLIKAHPLKFYDDSSSSSTMTYWNSIKVPAGKTRKLVASVKVGVCAAASLDLVATAFLKDANGDPYCEQSFVPQNLEVYVQSSSEAITKKKLATCSPTPAPTPVDPNVIRCNGPFVDGWASCGADLTNCGALYDSRTETTLAACLEYCETGGPSIFQCAFNPSGSSNCLRYKAGGVDTTVAVSPGFDLYYNPGPGNPGPIYTTVACGSVAECPDLYAFDGATFIFETDVAGAGKLGEAGAGAGHGLPQGTDYHVLETPLGLNENGEYELALVEDRQEVNYLDKARLYAVDIPEGTMLVEVHTGDIAHAEGEEKELNIVTRVVDAQISAPWSVVAVNGVGTMQVEKDVSAQVAAPRDGLFVHVGVGESSSAGGAGLEVDLGPLGGSGRRILVYRALAHNPAEAARKQQLLQVWDGAAWVAVDEDVVAGMGDLKGFFRTYACKQIRGWDGESDWEECKRASFCLCYSKFKNTREELRALSLACTRRSRPSSFLDA